MEMRVGQAHPSSMPKVRTRLKYERPRFFFREWRKHRGFTQEELASRMGVATPTISMIENAKIGFTDQTLVAFAEALNCTPADLLSRDPNDGPSEIELLKRIEPGQREQAMRVLEAFLPKASGE